MEILQIVDSIEDTIEKSFSILGYAIISKEELLSMMDEVRLKLPEELKQAKWVKEERQRILMEAQREAESIINAAKERVFMMIDDHEITKGARQKAESILLDAKTAEENMRGDAYKYTDSLLDRLEKNASVVLEEVKKCRDKITVIK